MARQTFLLLVVLAIIALIVVVIMAAAARAPLHAAGCNHPVNCRYTGHEQICDCE